MATLWIREYTTVPDPFVYDRYGTQGVGSAMAQEPGTDQSAVTFTTTTQSAAFGAGTKYVCIVADAAFHYVVAANPTATTNALRIPAHTPLFIGVQSGHKIAAVTAS